MPHYADPAWKPKATEGAVPRRASKYRFLPIWFPSKPTFAQDPIVTTIGDDMMKRILAEAKSIDLVKDDPWARLYAWRRHPYFSSSWHKMRLAFPGLGLGLASFAIYLGLESLGIISPEEAHH